MAKAARKRYESPLREAQARSTRMLVLDAARKLFAEKGYVATSVDEIATSAGVGRATVFASVGGKPALLKQAYDVAIVGDDAPVPLIERPRSRSIQADPDPRSQLARYAEVATEICSRVAGIYEAVRQASGADPVARDLWTEILRQRRVGMDNLIRALAGKTELRAGLDPKSAADLAWVLVDPGLYQMLVGQRGWSPLQYQAWLTDLLQTQLLPRRSGGRRPKSRARAG